MSTEVSLLNVPGFDTFSLWSLWPFLLQLCPFFFVFGLISCGYYLLCYLQFQLFFVLMPNFIKRVPSIILKIIEYLSRFFGWINFKWAIFVIWLSTTTQKKKKKKNRPKVLQIDTNITVQPSPPPSNLDAILEPTVLIKKRSQIVYKKIKNFNDFDLAKNFVECNKIENQTYKYR